MVRLYFSCRDADNRSRIAWLLLDLERPDRVLDTAAEPLMVPGPIGTFDDRGVMSLWMTPRDGQRWFYVIGWNVKNLAPLHNSMPRPAAVAYRQLHPLRRLSLDYDRDEWGRIFEINVAPFAQGRLNYIRAPGREGGAAYAASRTVATPAFGGTVYQCRIGLLHIDAITTMTMCRTTFDPGDLLSSRGRALFVRLAA